MWNLKACAKASVSSFLWLPSCWISAFFAEHQDSSLILPSFLLLDFCFISHSPLSYRFLRVGWVNHVSEHFSQLVRMHCFGFKPKSAFLALALLLCCVSPTLMLANPISNASLDPVGIKQLSSVVDILHIRIDGCLGNLVEIISIFAQLVCISCVHCVMDHQQRRRILYVSRP